MRHYCIICDVAGAFNGILERITTLHLSFSLSLHGTLPLLIHTKFSLFTPEIQTHLTLSRCWAAPYGANDCYFLDAPFFDCERLFVFALEQIQESCNATLNGSDV